MARSIFYLMLAPLLIAATPADQANLADAQCIVALGQLVSSENREAQEAAKMAVPYYMGRLDGRGSDPQLLALFTKTAEAMKEADLQPTLQRCAALLQQRGQEFQAMGQKMQDVAKAAPAK